MAADLVLIPYHGQPQHDPDVIYRSEAKSGTSHFHAYATLYVIRNGYRFTVALTPVSRGEPLEAVLIAFCIRLPKSGFAAACCFDRGFYSVGADPLSPGGPPSVPDACDLPRPPARRSARTERDQRLLDLAEQRLRDLHLARCPEAAGPRRDLRQMPLLSWSMASAWQATPDLRLLGTSASILRLGPGDVSPAVQHRDDLSTVASGPDSDLDTRSAKRLALRGDRPDLAECLGLVAPDGAGPAVVAVARSALDLLRFRRMLLWLTHVVEGTLGVRDSVIVELQL